jgi:acyl-CoA dehydrogenase
MGVIGLGMAGPTIIAHGTDEQKARYLQPLLAADEIWCQGFSEPDAGSDLAAARTRAERKGDVYVVNGQKVWSSFAHIADFCILVTQSDPDAPRYRNLTYLIVDMHAPGVEVRPLRQITGEAEFNEIFFNDVEVPVENRLGEEGQGFALGQKWLTFGRVKGQAAWCLGVAQRSLEMAMDYARQRVTFGQPLSERQAIQFMIADSAIELDAARLMVYRTAWMYDQGMDTRDESYMTKIYCTEMASRVVDRAMQIHGGVGLMKELPLEYWFRQVRSIRITEGVTEVLRWRLARNLTRGQGTGVGGR